jgi:hypothetical protein
MRTPEQIREYNRLYALKRRSNDEYKKYQREYQRKRYAKHREEILANKKKIKLNLSLHPNIDLDKMDLKKN